ncbi:hypothetical protein OAO34_02945 [Candidatus Poseidoniaceae archaeon]|jgi:hypothetical protein|nr:hypothetical protein [Euryarchaeota archaeon]MBT7244336.1 hypothetical protein [Euryarchaeota archaeon]MDC0556723.1 hypothetical protein [Candidatus Poseidoniaceae archaeon]NCF96792.1 hypothetical protein [Euryarchaeota archaeon]
MAGEVTPQGEGARSLHLRQLRVQWQIVTLQVLATLSLVWMYMEVVSTYVVGSIDHTLLFDTLESGLGTELPLGDWLTGSGSDGLARFYVPMGLGLTLGGSMALLAFQTPKFQQRVKLGVIITMILLLAGRFVFGYAWQLVSDGWSAPADDVLRLLEWPLLMMLSLVILTFYLLPIITGTKGIWGLSRRGVAWSIGFTLLFLGVHAILTFPLIRSQLGSYGTQLTTLQIIVSEPTVFGLVTTEQLSLILIACLMMVFQESAFGVIRQLEYAYRLPDSCKRDPEYVAQMDNLLNGHLRHTAIFLSLTVVTTTIALGFHGVLLDLVGGITGSQWAAQVGESIELTLTYGLVISALLFLGIMALLRFIVPWQRFWGLIESSFSTRE